MTQIIKCMLVGHLLSWRTMKRDSHGVEFKTIEMILLSRSFVGLSHVVGITCIKLKLRNVNLIKESKISNLKDGGKL